MVTTAKTIKQKQNYIRLASLFDVKLSVRQDLFIGNVNKM